MLFRSSGMPSELYVDVVIGASNPHRVEIEKKCNSNPKLHFHCQIDNISELMSKADLAIGAAGTTTWERCYLGVPSIMLVLADNQVAVAEDADKAGFAMSLGRSEDITSIDIKNALMRFISEPSLLLQYSKAANDVMDNYVGAYGIADKLIEL